MFLLDFIFPKFCLGCNKFGTYFCSACARQIKQGNLICPSCERASIGGLIHPLCCKKYGLDGLWSLGIYEDPLKKVIQKLKYRFVKDLAEVLTDLMIQYWARFSPQFLEDIKKDGGKGWVVVPVPLHPKRQKYRGFNQSAQMGKLLAQKLGLKYEEALKRISFTEPQVGLKGKERRQNLKGAFALSSNHKPSHPKDDQPMAGAISYLLVDDVWTTGSTLKECCSVLKKGGAKKVWAITLAR